MTPPVRTCPEHGLVLRDLRCPARHVCNRWHIVQDGIVIGLGSPERAHLFRGILEPRPGIDRKPMPAGPCQRGHHDWKFRAHRGLEGGWFCGTCPKLNRHERRKAERALRKLKGLPPAPRRKSQEARG